ncbi:NAD-dependent epimerase/dehydratase family protein [bacterium]|nr:NAD-dependent epimerase/dehydratase family protein [bacterium]
MPRRIFMTGAAGAVGRNVLPTLLEAGHHVRVLVHKSRPNVSGVEIVEGDLTQFDAAWLHDVDTVLHFAAVLNRNDDPALFHDVNVEGTRRLVQAMQARDRPPLFINISSVAVYKIRTDGEPWRTGDPCEPHTPYGHSKLEQERVAQDYERTHIVRLPLVVGAGDRTSGMFAKLARLRIFPVTNRRLSAIDARDVARLMEHLLRHEPPAGAVYTVSDGMAYRWIDLARHFARREGRRVFSPTIPAIALHPAAFRILGRPNGATHLRYDWHCEPNFPEGFAPKHRAYPLAFDA